MSATTPFKPYTSHLLRPGNTNCAGCGMSVGLQFLDEALGDEKPVLVIPSSCGIVTAGAFPTSGYGVPTAATTFASSPAVPATSAAALPTLPPVLRPPVLLPLKPAAEPRGVLPVLLTPLPPPPPSPVLP